MTITIVKHGVVKKYKVDLVIEVKNKIKIVYYKKTEIKEVNKDGRL